MKLRPALRLVLWGVPINEMSYNNMVAATERAEPWIRRIGAGPLAGLVTPEDHPSWSATPSNESTESGSAGHRRRRKADERSR